MYDNFCCSVETKSTTKLLVFIRNNERFSFFQFLTTSGDDGNFLYNVSFEILGKTNFFVETLIFGTIFWKTFFERANISVRLAHESLKKRKQFFLTILIPFNIYHNCAVVLKQQICFIVSRALENKHLCLGSDQHRKTTFQKKEIKIKCLLKTIFYYNDAQSCSVLLLPPCSFCHFSSSSIILLISFWSNFFISVAILVHPNCIKEDIPTKKKFFENKKNETCHRLLKRKKKYPCIARPYGASSFVPSHYPHSMITCTNMHSNKKK
ncbi:hypothetical protein RFI_27536 [Reticulomyxa filosa]|uniref:Uncharacterized protein n=1 Tax=Reticulomyxa filosa TaxID=46433 RepID=X6M773_RETFI|nr:hypothetical protein RFI_27536 [Reticulomyxa filosa]|eukprot:ETO09843.1 hypothetical protein RFI_27536 [Reticulomyxa filosa]